MTLVVQTLLVLKITDSGIALGVLMISQYGPVLLLGPWAGLIADRSDKRRLLMAVQRLSLTRDQLASFLQDFEQIKQFEKLFATVDSINTIILDEISVSAGTAFATANEALASIAAMADVLDVVASQPAAAQQAQQRPACCCGGSTVCSEG